MEAIFYKKNSSMPVVINLNNGTFRIQRICNGFEVWRSFSIADRIVEEPVFDIVSEDNLYVDYLLDSERVYICNVLSQKPVNSN